MHFLLHFPIEIIITKHRNHRETMAPNTDQVRLRRHAPAVKRSSSKEGDDRKQLQRVVTDLKDLRSNEIVVHGVIYDVETLKNHPGGELPKMLGGNDATNYYQMIHTYHVNKNLEKIMEPVGKFVAGSQDDFPEYVFDSEFAKEMKREVAKIVPPSKQYATYGWYARNAVYLGAFFYLQYLWVTNGPSLQLAVLYGIAHAFIGMNVFHDGVHANISSKPWINDLFGFTGDLIGGSKWLFSESHWNHHAYTMSSKDSGYYGTEPLAILQGHAPDNPIRQWYHKYQGFYFFILASFLWAASVFTPDIVTLQEGSAAKAGLQMDNNFIRSRRKYSVAMRMLYLYINVVLPLRYHGVSLKAMGHILLMGNVGSIILAMVLTMNHWFEGCELDPAREGQKRDNKDGAKLEPVCWYKASIESTSTIGGPIQAALSGGTTMNIEHHIFPRMSSAWLPVIQPTVRRVCAKHGVKYNYFPYVWDGVYSSAKQIHAIGIGAIYRGKE